MKIIYIKETEEEHNIIKKIIFKINKIWNIIKVQNINDKTIYYLPIIKSTKLSKYRIKKITNKIRKLLEKDCSKDIVLSEYLNSNQILKNYLYSANINILDGRYLFKNLIYKVIEYLFKIKNKEMKFRRGFSSNK